MRESVFHVERIVSGVRLLSVPRLAGAAERIAAARVSAVRDGTAMAGPRTSWRCRQASAPLIMGQVLPLCDDDAMRTERSYCASVVRTEAGSHQPVAAHEMR